MAGLLDGQPYGAGLLGNFQRGLAQIARQDPDEMRIKAQRQQILQGLGPNPSLPDVGNALLKIGDIEGFREITRMHEAKAQHDWTRTYQGGMLDVARKNAADPPAQLKILEASGIDPKSKEGQQRLFPRTEAQMSATDKKAILDAENDVPRLEQTIANIEKAKLLNPSVPSGIGASLRGQAAAKLPDWMVPDRIASPAQGEAAAEWDQMMGQEAIQMMGETLKGASTDFEMKKFLNIAADMSQPPKVREAAMDRFLSLANKELVLRRARSKDMRGGTYFKPEYELPTSGGASQGLTGGKTITGDKPPVPGAKKGKKPDGSDGWFVTSGGKHYLVGD